MPRPATSSTSSLPPRLQDLAPEIQVNGSPSQNVMRGGTGSGRPLAASCWLARILTRSTTRGPRPLRPGADDDGSGSAGVIEIARALKDHPASHDLKLVLFGGEEQGLFGSKQFVASLTRPTRARCAPSCTWT